MSLLSTEQKRHLAELILRLPSIHSDPQLRELLVASLPMSVRQIISQTGSPYSFVNTLINTVETQALWPLTGPPLTITLVEGACYLAPEDTILRAELESMNTLVKSLAQHSGPLQPQTKPHKAIQSTSLRVPLLRRVLLECFSAGELETLCYDYYQSVYINNQGQSHPERVQSLLVFCQQEGSLDELLTRLRRERSRCLERLVAESGSV